VTGQVLTLDETLQETIPALLSLLDALPEDNPFLKLDPPQRRQRTLYGLKQILLRESQVQPLVLVFEDLHWHDNESQALLDSLVESLPTAQLLLLVNYRPEYTHNWRNKTYYTQLRLDPLPPKSSDELLKALLGEDTSLDPLKTLLIERTEGNPFFLEESVRRLVETYVLAGEPGVYRLAQDLPTIQVPPTVQAVLAARIDRLPEDVKRLLQTAAVIGTEVPLTLLQAIAEMPADTLHRGLTHLQATEFLYETSLFPERVYTFKHALTHEVAYGSLLQERRRVLHARIVETLEALGGDQLTEQVERLAHHALRGEVWGKALLYLRQTGNKAMEQLAFQEAVVRFEHALAAWSRLPESRDTMEQGIDVQCDLRQALVPLQAFEPGFKYLCVAETLAERLDDRQRLGRICTLMTHYFWIVGEYERAIERGQRALTLTASDGYGTLQVTLNNHLGQIYYALGDYHQALDALRQNVAFFTGERLYERVGMIGPVLGAVGSHAWIAHCLEALGGFVEGRRHAQEAVRIAEAAAHPGSTIYAHYCLGRLALRQGDLSQAILALDRALTHCRAANISLWHRLLATTLGVAYALCGRSADAVPLLEEAITLPEGGSLSTRRYVSVSLGEAALVMGRHDEAHTHATHALELAHTGRERGDQAWTHRLLGALCTRDDSPDNVQAKTHYEQALTLATELGMRPLQAHCHRGLGTLYSQTNQPEQACTELTTALEMYRDMEMRFWLPETEAVLAGVEGA
jgi:tetratricopeptide (TPR) repeat protein